MSLQHRVTQLPAPRIRSLCWVGDSLVDWVAGGTRYFLDGTIRERHVNYAYRFDAAVVSPSGRFAVIYERLGTKGLLLENGEIRRELNRSFYQAHVYEFPVLLFALPDGREVIAHCPEEYNRLEIEECVTGERLTDRSGEDREDFFHSRLAVDPTGTWLMSAGWIWHPLDSISLFEIARALREPSLLDHCSDFPNTKVELSSAAFAPGGRLIASSRFDGCDFTGTYDPEVTTPARIWSADLQKERFLSEALLQEEAGTLMAVGEQHAVGFYDHPKLIHIPTGHFEHRWQDLRTGHQHSSILSPDEAPPPLALDPLHSRFAIADGEGITVVEVQIPRTSPP